MFLLTYRRAPATLRLSWGGRVKRQNLGSNHTSTTTPHPRVEIGGLMITKASFTVVACAALLWADAALATVSPPQRCQASKNKAAGKYAACRENAEAKLASTGDTTKYDEAITKCETKYQTAWQKAEQRAADAMATCPDSPLTQAQFKMVIDEHCDNVATALGGGGLADCSGDLATCSTNLTTCTASLSTCNAGTAALGDVLNAKTFSSSAGLGVTGAMPNIGAVTLTPSTSDQAIAAGYHNGSGKCEGDPDLVTGNIKSGVNLFGVSGDANVVNTGAATATATDMVSGKTAYVNGSLVTGTVTAGSDVNGPNGSTTFTIPDAFYAGSKIATANDANLVASNIKKGVNLFGVTGTVQLPPLSTGQTTSRGAGSDGALQKGATRAFSDNGDGTITDNTTGLMWEKKEDFDNLAVNCTSAAVCPNPHDADNRYTWSATSQNFDGTVVSVFLAQLNAGSGFAGHTDWRLPNMNELESLRNAEVFSPATYTAFNTGCTSSCNLTDVNSCSCTVSYYYWSSSTYQSLLLDAWVVYFLDGGVDFGNKSFNLDARAVRGGS
jgi:hypothetical protein